MGEKLKADVKGYEIHMGVTKFNESHQHFVQLQEGHMDGAINQEENVLGTYLHGIFDNDKFRKILLDNIRRQKGIETKDQTLSFEEFKETQYVELGKIIKEHLDVDKILEIMSEF
jgi:adenosylcobyric acid synthase